VHLKEALELAIKSEAKARDNYRKLAKTADDQETRLLFEQLAQEEEMHHKRLTERLKAVKLLDY